MGGPARLVVLVSLLAACGDDAPPISARREHHVQARVLPSARGKIVDRRGVTLADDRPGAGGPERVYPHGDLAAHVVGYTSAILDDEADRYRALGYEPAERIGRYGVEHAWESFLRGKPGRELQVVDRQGRVVADPAIIDAVLDDRSRLDPVPGRSVVLTLDAELQRIAEDAVAPHRAAAVAVVEVATGKLLALVSRPAFDPGVMTRRLTAAEQAALTADPRRPFVDKVMRATYAPGSLFGFVTAIAALEDGVTTEDARLACPGEHTLGGATFACTARHGALELSTALQQVCNVHLWKLAEQVGLDRIAEVAGRFGFGHRTGLGLNGDAPGRVPTRGWYEQRGPFRAGHTLDAAAGAGDVEVTVLQVAMAYAALAGGARHVPQLVERIEAPDGAVVQAFAPALAPGWRAPAPAIVALLHRTLAMDVNRRGGRSAAARSELVDLAGHAATADVRARPRPPRAPPPDGWDPTRRHAWFAGWAPAGAPEIAIVVLIEHGGAGTRVAAPVARQIVDGWWTSVR